MADQIMTWHSLESEINRIYRKIAESGQKYDAIVGIVRGGIVPARMLASKSRMNMKEIYCLTIEKIGEERILAMEITKDLSGKSILLVEDVLETGESLKIGRDYLHNEKGANVATAALYVTPDSRTVPDFYLRAVDEIPVFPWEQ